MKDLHQTPEQTDGVANPEQAVESRRKFLKQAGKFAIYTPPAVMVLMKPSFAGAKGSFEGPRNCPTKFPEVQRLSKKQKKAKILAKKATLKRRA